MAGMVSLWQRGLESDVSGVKSTFSSWDSCMTKTYCKWPAIIGIIIGSLIVLSLVWCLARCLCCGAEMCCGCLSCMSCCTSCCRNGHHRNRGYEQPAPTPQAQPYQQYQSAPPPMYGAPRASPAQYAHFETPSQAKSGQRYNEDALPAMPSWDTAATTRHLDHDDMEMEKMPYASAQAAPMLPQTHRSAGAGTQHSGDMGMMGGPQYHHQPAAQHGYGLSSPYEQCSPYEMNQAADPYTDAHSAYGRPQQSYSPYGYSNSQRQPVAYEPSVAPPPSYRTAAPSIAPPAIGRKPVSGSWRDL